MPHLKSPDDVTRLAAVQALLRDAFTDGFDEHDWEHSLGGVHVLGIRSGTQVTERVLAERRQQRDTDRYRALARSVPGVFVAGDMTRGQSLIVWAIAEGRAAAVEIGRAHV